jgi:hypothetical protein
MASRRLGMDGLDQCFSKAGPRPGTGPPSYKKKNLPGRGVTKFDNHYPLCIKGWMGPSEQAWTLYVTE